MMAMRHRLVTAVGMLIRLCRCHRSCCLRLATLAAVTNTALASWSQLKVTPPPCRTGRTLLPS